MSDGRQRWIGEFAKLLGTEPPNEEETGEILELAATAAHASERIAAPLACWLAGRDRRPLAELRAIADAVGRRPPATEGGAYDTRSAPE